MTRTGTAIARGALREIGVLDPIEAGHAEMIADALVIGSELLDSWRTDKLTIAGRTRSVYSLTTDTQSYTLGSGGTLDQDWPSAIHRWSVIPDDDAADPIEHPMGRPLNFEEWQQIRVKSTTGAYPTRLYFDRSYSAGLANLLVWPIPDNGDVDIVLYQAIPAITSLVAATSYDLQPGFHRALRLHLALEVADRYGKAVSQGLNKRAAEALGNLRRQNILPRESRIRGEFVIGQNTGRRTYNIYNGGNS